MQSFFPLELAPDIIDFHAVELLRFPLIAKFYQAQGYNIKCGRQELILSLQTRQQEILAAARLLPLENGDYWLRNLLVAKIWREKGIGHKFMQQALIHMGDKNCYCFTLPEVEAFYRRLGFINLRTQDSPPAIADLAQRYELRSRGWRLMGHGSDVVSI